MSVVRTTEISAPSGNGGKSLDDSASDMFGGFGLDDALDLAKKFF